ncbi:cupin domain-containing protein [Neorhizobium sp. T786]|uniref:cupin domain-containing protein n=1 Tax=Pseudorhizobium xiangyangii TaxID=2883104 RepID=UPI001CFFC07F|nr:cupin domain-containing protein [Neorhizobium xiangyangii]MCB5201936.1 cupin domain-containing protein [Neorhizobium xiangyangii]
MFHVIPQESQQQFKNRTILFEGGEFGVPLSLFLIDNEPGQGPDLHVHPYAETWIVRSGRARFTVGEETIEPKPGDIVVVHPNTPHCFKNIGDGRLELTCIHANEKVIQSFL